MKGLGVPYQLWLPGFWYFDPDEVERIAMSWLVDALPHHRLLARRFRGVGIMVREVEYWPSQKLFVIQGRAPRPMNRVEARTLARRIVAALVELGHPVRTRDLGIAWSRERHVTVGFCTPVWCEPGSLLINLRTGRELAERWPWMDYVNDQVV